MNYWDYLKNELCFINNNQNKYMLKNKNLKQVLYFLVLYIILIKVN